uniref:Signal sequence receptor subunit 2 n=1 Tax=Felis catus TaxID=9685 RepID=A0ABI7XBK8_FELCA
MLARGEAARGAWGDFSGFSGFTAGTRDQHSDRMFWTRFHVSAALDVELSDDSFPPEDFGIVSGMLNVKWDRIAPASNVSHTVVLRPLKAGYFNFTSATVTYLAQEDGPVVVGFTSAPGQGGILAQREFDRRFSPHFLDWAAFGVMTLPSIGIPLLLWYSSKRKYDTPKTKKN